MTSIGGSPPSHPGRWIWSTAHHISRGSRDADSIRSESKLHDTEANYKFLAKKMILSVKAILMSHDL